ncbi:MAG: 16S rRNA (cytosine(1402)-N(4))-methyltransferase RsmH, partial [Acidobacteriota bacterium]
EDAERGFSFAQDGPLDMRMDRSLSVTAADLVNELSEKDLADLIYEFGEERLSRRIARAIVAQRKESPFSRTRELAELVARVVPKSKDTRRIHPATRTFQALRLAVNRELETLGRFLSTVLDQLAPGGRLSVVAFHSLEDRMVKERFREWARSCRCPRSSPVCTCGGQPLVRLVTRKALRPSEEEVERNPRARSARLRVMEKL